MKTAARRHWYLTNLGIDEYISRDAVAASLVVAPAEVSDGISDSANHLSSGSSFDSSVSSSHSSSFSSSDNSFNHGDATSTATAATSAMLLDSLRDLSDSSQARVGKEGAEVAGTASKAPVNDGATGSAQSEQVGDSTLESSSQQVAFRLACWQPNDAVLVFSHVPVGGEPTADEMRLLANILGAVGCKMDSPLGVPRFVDWPLPAIKPGQSPANGSLQEARAMLDGFLNARVTKTGVLWVLCFGHDAARWLIPDFTDTAQGQTLHSLAGGVRCLVTPSLQRMIDDAALKPLAWQQLQQLTLPDSITGTVC